MWHRQIISTYAAMVRFVLLITCRWRLFVEKYGNRVLTGNTQYPIHLPQPL